MDKLGFVKTVEAILAAVVALSVYNFIQTYNINQVQVIDRSPVRELNDFLDVIDLNSIIESNDYLTLDSWFNNLFFETVFYYFEPVYYEEFIVNAEAYTSYPNISFIHHFPEGIDENSIRVISGTNELSAYADFNWYRLPIRFNQSLIDEYVEINATLQEPEINNKSLKFFVRGVESSLALNYWNESQDKANVSIIAYVPEINTSERAYLYFMKNGFINQTYPSFDATITVDSFKFPEEKAPTAEVVFSPINATTSDKNFFLQYSLFTSKEPGYNEFSSISTGINVEFIDEGLKGGTVPYTATIRGDDSVTRIVPLSNGFVELRVYGGYS